MYKAKRRDLGEKIRRASHELVFANTMDSEWFEIVLLVFEGVQRLNVAVLSVWADYFQMLRRKSV